MSPILGDKYLCVAAQEYGTYLVAHAKLYHHAPCKVAGMLKVAYCACADIVKSDGLRNTAAHAHGDLVQYLAAGNVGVVIVGHGHGIARSLTSGYYGYLVNGIAVLHAIGHYGVARLVVSGDLFIFLGNHTAALFGAHHGAGNGLLKLHHGDVLFLEAGSQYGGLVQHVFKVCAGHAAGALCQHLKVNILGKGLALGVYPQNCLAALNVGIAHGYLPVKAAGTQQSGVKYVGTVCGGKDNYALVYRKAVHLHQQLVEGLLTLIVSAAKARASLAAYSVDFVDENNCGSKLLCVCKQVAYAAGAHAYEHLHKVGTGNGEEGNPRFACYGLCKESFTCARRTHQQAAFGYAGAHLGKALGGAHKLNNLPQLFLFFLCACNVRKGDLGLAVHVGTGTALAEIHYVIAAALSPHHKDIEQRHAAEQQQIWQYGGKKTGLRIRIDDKVETVIRLSHLFKRNTGKLSSHRLHIRGEDIKGRDIGIEIRFLGEQGRVSLAVGIYANQLQLSDFGSGYFSFAHCGNKLGIGYVLRPLFGKVKAGYQQDDYSHQYKIHQRCGKSFSVSQFITSPVCLN